MSVHAHGGCKHTRAEAPGQPSCKTLDTMPWNLLMNNGWKCMSKVGICVLLAGGAQECATRACTTGRTSCFKGHIMILNRGRPLFGGSHICSSFVKNPHPVD